MNRILQDLVNLLELENLEVNLFRGQSRDLGGKSVFGGQVIGQALLAASRTVEERLPHSLHAYFLRPGDMFQPIVYEVERLRDGNSFTARHVQAIQHGKPLLAMNVNFQKPEEGLEHQIKMPDVPPPEKLASLRELQDQWIDEMPEIPERVYHALTREMAIEFKPVDPWNVLRPTPSEPRQSMWFRAAGKLPDDPILHRCVLAYASDFALLSTALRPHGKSWYLGEITVASIDHSLWFHRDGRVDDWLLYVMDSPTSQGARGLSHGQIFDRQGRLIASVAQENLMRANPPGTST